MKTLITFVYFETENSKLNLDFFVRLGLTNSPDHQFNFIINSPSGGDQIPNRDNISTIKGHNKGYDFGAYAQSLENVKLEDFDRFIFINDTCRGPFLPDYLPAQNWVNIINNLIDNEVKLVGSTWNYFDAKKRPGNLHIQSYFFATDLQGVNLLLNNDVFDTINKSKDQIITNHEICMSKCFLKSNFKIKPLQLSQYNGKEHGDILHEQKRYYNTILNPLEAMFIKTNRINDQIVKNYTEWKIQKYEALEQAERGST